MWSAFFGMVGFMAGMLISGFVVNDIRVKQMNVLEKDLKAERERHTYTASILEQCRQDLSVYTNKYNTLVSKIKEQEIEYNKKLKAYADEIARIKTAQSYQSIKPEVGKDTCENLKLMLDKFVEVESNEKVNSP
ncbi:hypothetical protein [Hydrogenobacter thermophilus]|jgi:hypothetical protein|uniref:hypothetical protein n=1 Tax=Hydrogenobacter thermophilus TaxID=940 RepID=UPI0030F858E2